MADKTPDMVVAHPENMEYPTDLGSPSFLIPDTLAHQKERGVNASHYLENKFIELKKEYFDLLKICLDTEMVYGSKYNFIPVVGKVYHLYTGANNKYFLSIIGPNEWNMKYEGSFEFTHNNTWQRKRSGSSVG